jgi:hypothetical protein
MKINKLKQLCRERSYSIQRKGKKINWYKNSDKNRAGVCYSVQEAFEEISNDYNFLLNQSPKRCFHG